MSDPVAEIVRAPSRSSDEARFYRLQLLASMALVSALVLGLGFYFVWQHWSDFERDLRQSEARYLHEQHQALVQEVENAKSYLAYMRARAEPLLKEQLRERVDDAYGIAYGIYQRGKDILPEASVQQAIKETLRPLRFAAGRGYYFIQNLNSDSVLMPIDPSVEGRSPYPHNPQGYAVVSALLRAAQGPTQRGFARYRWRMPDDPLQMVEKLAFVRRFDPYDWLIGASDSLAAVETRLQRESLDRLRAFRFGETGYIGVLRQDGQVLLSPTAPAAEGMNVGTLQWKTERDLLTRFLEVGRQGGGEVRYDWVHPVTGRPAPKMAYVSAPTVWGWILVAGFYIDDLGKEMEERRAELARGVDQRVWTTVAVLAMALAASVGMSWLVTGWLRRIVGGYQLRMRRSDSMLRERARQLYLANFFIDHVSEIVVLADARLRIAYVNPFGCRALGGTLEDLVMAQADLLERFAAGGEEAADHYETIYRTPDGRRLELEITASRITYEGDVYYSAIARDITERKHAEWQLRLSAKVFDNAAEGMFVANERRQIVAVNDAFTRITGYDRLEALGRGPEFLQSDRNPPGFYEELWMQLLAHGQWIGEVWSTRKSGEPFPQWLSVKLVRNEDGAIANYIAAFSDITENRAQEERIRHLAQYDFLTDLPNRFLLRDRLERAILAAGRRGTRVGLLFIDLDRFKTINDSLGHGVGDGLLREVASRLLATVRASDTVSRQGGDEFVVLINDIDGPDAAGVVAGKVLRALSEPCTIDGHELQVTPSIGIAIHPDDGAGIDELLKNADMAMYAAKEAGRATCRFFTPELNRRASDRLWIENNLRRALGNDELELHFQPQFSLDGRRLIGAEALVRWRQPDGTLIMPGQFIPVAEDTGLILPLGDWVLGEACRRAAELLRHRDLLIAVNLSAVQVRRPGLAERVAGWLSSYGIPPAALELEVTESVLMDESDVVADTFSHLRGMGVSLAIDDFGTGYSSLAYLKRFRVDKLKIDRRFVSELRADNPDSGAIAKAVIGMARSLHMDTLAEGVETEEQYRCLVELGCDQCQGYLLGRPMPYDDFLAFLRGGAAAPADRVAETVE
ncbi:bifunctional diguanylate cyclase/phosphodiesterase [Azospirillum picis]|uniref:Diguanylate cyclase (GGDEF)-like protein/PAS domain S-box-containing protein n=1 Tax=Azospirillum picis TaxID=488438 RepID=A0ABU0MF95_9PROT|nr:EAL domain-containing protein [Azospirillum picis]MBP2298267.1 diguanylate cyclase (GGDEF)-like protein/PAS domain S-box-containing protein [Azospirillum picis]MDQ0532104.1 diguanylate cyclase (GGDEF)-like protein/PAS domain S-box-containing protein [Azospirillum picis]